MKLRFILPFFLTLCVVLLFHYTQFFAVKFYPVIANFTAFAVFFVSSFSEETVIQKFAKMLEGGTLDDFTRNYTRRLTYVWCVFCFLNLSISAELYNILFSFVLSFCNATINNPIKPKINPHQNPVQ